MIGPLFLIEPWRIPSYEFLQGAKPANPYIRHLLTPLRSPVNEVLIVEFKLRHPWKVVRNEAVLELKRDGWLVRDENESGISFGKGEERIFISDLVTAQGQINSDETWVHITRPANWLDKARLWVSNKLFRDRATEVPPR